jgi:hypothetical protein
MTIVRRYKIQSHGEDFQTGLLQDGTQILLVPTSAAQVACVQFDKAGSLVSSKELDKGSITRTQDAIVVADKLAQFAAKRAPIDVITFNVPAIGVGIRPRPDSFDEFLRDPVAAEPDCRYREKTSQQVSEWDENDRFVLVTWGKEYWMNGDGSVFAT